MKKKLVTVATFSQAIEAHLIKSKLEWENIECTLADENIVNINWLYSNAVGGVKLQVKESDVKKALDIIGKKQTISDVIQQSGNGFQCPKCNSSNVQYEKFSRRLVFISWLLLGVPFPFLKRKYKCVECNYEWKMKPAPK